MAQRTVERRRSSPQHRAEYAAAKAAPTEHLPRLVTTPQVRDLVHGAGAIGQFNSRLAVLNTLATVFFLSVGTLICIYLILINRRQFEFQLVSFSVFIVAGIGGLWWVLRADRPSAAINVASVCCPLAMFYTVTNILVGRPGSQESTDPLIPFLVTTGAFAFAVAAMLIPLISEFDVALGRTTAGGE